MVSSWRGPRTRRGRPIWGVIHVHVSYRRDRERCRAHVVDSLRGSVVIRYLVTLYGLIRVGQRKRHLELSHHREQKPRGPIERLRQLEVVGRSLSCTSA
jgi:hypothetical protein